MQQIIVRYNRQIIDTFWSLCDHKKTLNTMNYWLWTQIYYAAGHKWQCQYFDPAKHEFWTKSGIYSDKSDFIIEFQTPL